VYLLGTTDRLTPDARTMYQAFANGGGRVVRYERRRFARAVARADVALDAMLGTGSQGGLRGDFAAAAAILNAGAAPVVAVDIPTGVNATTGAVEGVAVAADVTVTFGLPKLGLTQFPARGYAGDIRIADVGYPRALTDELAFEPGGAKPGYVARFPDAAAVAALLPPRPLNLHKGAAGRAYCLAGSRGLSGAAVLAARSCLRAGAGLVEVGLPAELDAIFSAAALEPLSHALPQTEGGALAPAALGPAKAKVAVADAVAIGPGLGRAPETGELLAKLIAGVRKPLVVDADGLYLLGVEGLTRRRLKGVLTPHPGEMARLFGVAAADVEADRLRWARELAARTGMAVILKGYLSVVAAPGERDETWLNPTGNPGLASGGTGDVLTGVVLAFLAAGLTPLAAARAGAYVHGLAGDIAAARLDERALVAGDVCEELPAAFRRLRAALAPDDGETGGADEPLAGGRSATACGHRD
jgi:NAD(P)H-hydrate epimerase